MRPAAKHIAVKNAVNWMGSCPSLTAAIQIAARGAGKPQGFAYTAPAKTAG